jgi:hypothetical protein
LAVWGISIKDFILALRTNLFWNAQIDVLEMHNTTQIILQILCAHRVSPFITPFNYHFLFFFSACNLSDTPNMRRIVYSASAATRAGSHGSALCRLNFDSRRSLSTSLVLQAKAGYPLPPGLHSQLITLC